MVTVGRLSAEHLVDPLGLDVAVPRLSWVVCGAERQICFRIRVTGDREWDSGWVRSDRTVDISYGGPPLQPEDRCRWTVEVEDETGARALSAPARVERMPADWAGSTWICLPPPTDAHDGHRPCAHVRTVVDLPAAPVAARLHVTGGGLVEPWLNGAQVGDDRLAPGWTDYAQRVRCRSFDVTAALTAGRSAVGAVIGDGWYAGRIGWDGGRAHYGRVPVARLLLVVHLADGSVVRIGSDETWRARCGPVRAGDLLAGERYDARDALPGWAEAAYDDSGWERAWPDAGPAGALVATTCEPVRVLREVPGQARAGRPGSWLVDLGEVIGGWPRLMVRGEPGRIVRLRCAEALEGDGSLHTANLRGAQCTDEVVLAGGELTWEPWTTYRGFRYVEVTGAQPVAVAGVVAATDARPTGDFSCSSALLTSIWDNVRRTVRANTIGLPTDCIQRDERLGWLDDADNGFGAMTYLFDLGEFWAAWLQEVRGAQSVEGAFPDVAPRLVHLAEGAPGWGDAGVLLPWSLWQWFADRRVLEESLVSMARWPRWVLAANPDLRWRERRGHDFGDWLAPGQSAPKDVVAQAFWARSSAVAAAAARVVGRPDRALEQLAAGVREAFVADHVDACGRVANGTQTAQLLALAFDLLPAALRRGAERQLVASVEADGLRTGFLGTRHLLPALTAAGRVDLAYALALSESPPSWVHMVRSGATTVWERWDGWTIEDGFANPYMNSLCHVSLGSVAEWLHATVGGLARDPSVPGWTRAVVRPLPGGGVTAGRTSYDSRSGPWSVEWELDRERLRLEVEVPVGCAATVHVSGGPVTEVGPGRWALDRRQEMERR
jgi:alpha-L-rhamnosidase